PGAAHSESGDGSCWALAVRSPLLLTRLLETPPQSTRGLGQERRDIAAASGHHYPPVQRRHP
ncbi:MAG: hypothetical protein WBD41_19490, partial [Rhodococcus sp. (in: high G+C Gram-positive bacteria)]